MKTIELKVPDTFTDAQVEFIKNSAMSQIEAEIKKDLKIPQVDIDAADAVVADVKTAMGLIEKEITENGTEGIV